MANRILLPNRCEMSTPSVNPSNWKTGGKALINKNWRVQYYFFDPNFKDKYPSGKLIVVKGMNQFKDLNDRKDATQSIIDDELYQNQKGYNPILNRYTEVANLDSELNEHLPFIEAFKIAAKRLECSDKHRKEIVIAINRISRAADKLKYGNITISQLKRRELKRILETCNLSDNYFNKYKTYISRLFIELVEYECCETNLTRDIRRRKITKTEREVLSPEHYYAVLKYLKNYYYEFYRYTMIFSYSGARSEELFRLQVKDVDLKNQEFKVLIKKGSQYKEVTKVIIKDAIPFWREVLRGAKQNDYVFSKGLVPGVNKILSNQITKRWYRLVKKSNNIFDREGNQITVTADFYAFKHAFLDSLPEETARKIAHHTNSKTTSIYRVNQEKRDREALKQIEVKLKIVS